MVAWHVAMWKKAAEKGLDLSDTISTQNAFKKGMDKSNAEYHTL